VPDLFWLEELRKRGDAAGRLIEEVVPVLQRPDLAIEDATDLYHLLTRYASSMAEMIFALQREDAGAELVQRAEHIESVFDELAAHAAGRVVEAQKHNRRSPQ
jgi:hypothetical protein